MSAPGPSSVPFFVLTFAITWGLQWPGVLAQQGWLPGDPRAYLPLAGLGIFGPLLAATILSRRDGGMPAVRELYRPLLRWRAHPLWYGTALLLPGVSLMGLLALMNLAGRQGPTWYLFGAGAVAFAVVASLGEEVGWRGYALPRLERRWGRFGAATGLGVLWYLWHLPMFVGQGVPLDLVLVMLLMFTGGSLFFSWIYHRTGGSLLLVVLAHVGVHLNNSHRALPDEVLPLVAHAMVYAGLGLGAMWGVRLAPGSRSRCALTPGVH